MSHLQRLRLTTRGGVQDLGRVVNVLALLDLSPVTFVATADGDALKVDAWLCGDERKLSLCLARLRACAAIREATLSCSPVSEVQCATLSA